MLPASSEDPPLILTSLAEDGATIEPWSSSTCRPAAAADELRKRARERTIDADILIVPEQDSLYRALPRLKEELQLNVEIASPAHFIPELPGWRERSLPIERGHAKDLADVAQLLARGLVEPHRLRELFGAIEPRLHRYPAVDPPSFRKRLDDALRPR